MSYELSDDEADLLVAALEVAIAAFTTLRDKLDTPGEYEDVDPEVMAQKQREMAREFVDNITAHNPLLKAMKANKEASQ